MVTWSGLAVWWGTKGSWDWDVNASCCGSIRCEMELVTEAEGSPSALQSGSELEGKGGGSETGVGVSSGASR